ncbi:MAG: hypothetical protein PF489_07760 [Salinivirgaceae bacterium]|jgi:hypothetical protein|nr:hypothetical protein [Salinivirgaceae bacterium]
MLPEKNNPQWRRLVTGEQNYPLKNFVLQMKVTQTATDIRAGLLSVDKAVEDIYALCQKYEKAVSQDMEVIFSN